MIQYNDIIPPDRDVLREIRKGLELTQEEAADLCGVHRDIWSAWETGRTTMNSGHWVLFLLQIGKHPNLVVSPRRLRAARQLVYVERGEGTITNGS